MSTRTSSAIQQLKILVCLASAAWLALVGGASAQIAVTGTNQTGAVPLSPTWTAASDSLISGLEPTMATGNIGEYTHGNAANLTKPGNPLTIYAYSSPQATNLAVCGNDGTAGSLLVYTLPASTYGYNLTNITVYGGWQDAGRDAQAYTVYYSTVDNPTNFVVLTAVRYIPSNPSSTGDATRVVINDAAGAAVANNVAALKFDFTTPNGGSRENGGAGYTAITVAGAAATSIIPVPQPIFGASPVAEPYSYVKSGSFSGPEVPLSPDPLVAYRWPNPQASDDLQVYLQKPKSVTASTAASFGNLQSLTGNAPNVAVNGQGSIRMDFGQENAAWLEFDSPDLTGSVHMSISEYNEPAVVNNGPAHPVKTAAPVKYGNTYRLELNGALYEGVRFGWIHVRSFASTWHITDIRLVCQTKPTNYNGSFSCSDPMLTRIWYAGAYGVKLNLLKDYFGAILMDRGDRISWTGDAHPSQAAALVAFGNYDFIRTNIANTSSQGNGIKSYPLYWVLSLIDYYNYTGDTATLNTYVSTAQSILNSAYSVYGTNPALGFYGWDERLGAGFENPSCQEAQNAYKMLSIRAWQAFAAAMGTAGRADLQTQYSGYANAKIAALRQNAPWYQNFGLHACADAVNTGILNDTEKSAIFTWQFTDRVNRVSFSPFNQYFVIQAMAGMNQHDAALGSIRDLWGGMIQYGGTTFFEDFRPSWTAALGANDAVPNNQCGYTSLCHPWGGGVTKWLSEEVLGIKPTSPGFKSFEVTPHLGRSLTSVTGTTPTPNGPISASFNVASGACGVTVPAGTVGRVGIPKVEKSINGITVNGQQAWNGSFLPVPGIGDANQDADFVYLTELQPGTYTIAVAYGGTTPAFVEAPEIFPARFVGEDAVTSGNWGGVYGKDGSVLCNYNGNSSDKVMLPAYVSSVNYYMNSGSGKPNAVVWTAATNDARALAPDATNGTSRKAAALFTGDPAACQQAFTVTINLNGQHAYQVALYFADWDDKGRKVAVDLFDESTLHLIAPTKIVQDFHGGKYLVYSYDKSARFRIYQTRGDNAVLSGIFFDPLTPYQQWLAANGITDTDPSHDTDHDGLSNFAEYAFGLDPTTGAGAPPATAPNRTGGTFTYTRPDPALTGVSYAYQYSTTLSGEWTPVIPAVPDVVTSGSGNIQTVTVNLTGAPGDPLANPKLFIRVVATGL